MILVTGCAGFIGSNLTDELLAEGFEVIGIDDFNDYYSPNIKKRNISKALEHKNFSLVEGDICDRELIGRIFKRNKIEKVVHLAARAGVRPSLENPKLYFDVNVFGSLNLLNAAKELGVKQFVYSSSSSVYGLNEAPFSESQQTNSMISPYAVSKRSAEMLCSVFANNFSIPITCLRFFTVYGPRGRPDMAVYKFTDRIEKGKPIERYGKGDMKRDFTYVDDILSGIKLALNKPFDFEIINFGNNQPVELNYLIELIEESVGKKAKIIQRPVPKGDVPITFADISKAKRLLGWEPAVGIESGIGKFVEWFKENERK